MTNSSVAIIGVGRLGGALAIALSCVGYAVEQLIARQPEKTQFILESITPKPEVLSAQSLENITAQIIFITVPDTEIETIAESLAKKLKHRPIVFHASGALSSGILSSLSAVGCTIASLHPLVSISDSIAGAERFKDAYFCVEGESKAVRIGKEIVARLEGKPFAVDGEFKPLYHASAVMASGHVVALLSAAVETLAACGLSVSESQKILLPLVSSTVANLATQSPAQALTGTFARADVETLKRHLEAMRENVSPEISAIYAQLGKRSLSLAERQGANAAKLAEMRKILAENEE